ncbi:WG repeat-containing protein [Lewinella sp. JB7]|uniref:WG repeat-containing protein n=1 Tax=Lewinella sp. JB7 TaxID=2962887 RepID=UPI0020C9E732|nr:WG repeat-containing protein [Lewinella sp. JB7]MCP9237529.1 WG repeat-containing protein [Lewinella sp. JB7]
MHVDPLMRIFIYLLILLGPTSLAGQSVEIKEKKGEKYFVVKRDVIAGPFVVINKVYATSQYIVKDAKWGIVNEQGREVVPARYDSI